MGWPIYLSLILGGLLFVVLIFEIVWVLKMKKRFTFLYRGKLLTLEVRPGRATLFLDGNLVDEFSGTRVRSCMLRASVEGEEVLVRIRFGLSPKAEALAGGNPIEQVS